MEFINKGLAIGASLVAGSVMALSASSAQAATINFLNGSAGVSGSTTFTFVGSNGLFESDLLLTGGGPVLLSETSPGFIIPMIGNDFEGTCDICSFTYDFGNTTDSFSLILNSGGNGSVSSSTDAIFETSGSGILVRFEDRGGDRDFNDFRFTVAPVTTTTTVPEPTTLAGLGLVAGALAFSRRRKSNKAV